MKRLRVLAFLEAFTVTGPAKNLLQFAALAGDQEQIDTTIAVFRRPGDPEVFLDAARDNGVPVETIEERGRFDRTVLGAMRELLGRLRPDIVQTHAVKGHFLARKAGLPRRKPWVAFHHGYTWPDFRVRLYNQLDRWSLRRARRVVTMSRPFAGELESMGVEGRRIAIIHNAIRPDWGASGRGTGAALRATLGIPSDRKVILIVGRLSREKDHLALIDAVAELHRDGLREAHLLIVGDGPERGRIEARAAAVGIQSHVTLTGQVTSAEPYYGLADVAVLSSRSEGSPNALLEAMAVGVPVVATAVGGIPEIVEDRESALLIPPGDSRKLSDAIGEVLRDSGLAGALVKEATGLIERNHSPSARVRKIAEVYRGMLGD